MHYQQLANTMGCSYHVLANGEVIRHAQMRITGLPKRSQCQQMSNEDAI